MPSGTPMATKAGRRAMSSQPRYQVGAGDDDVSAREYYYVVRGEMGELRGEVGESLGRMSAQLGELTGVVRVIQWVIPMMIGIAGVAIGAVGILSVQ